MLGFVFEVENDALRKYFGYKSYLDLPVFHRTLGDCIFNELKMCEAVEVNVLSFDEYTPDNPLLNDDIITLFSNNYIAIDCDDFVKTKSLIKEFYLCDSYGNICGFYCGQDVFDSILNECADIGDLQNKLKDKYFDFPRICCVKKFISIEKSEDYFNLIKYAFDDKYSMNLPEVAQSIYTSGKIPKGDYVIVPPVYIGEGVQIERGSIIGPYSVVYNNVLVAAKSDIKRSVIFENTYISDNCFIDGSLCCCNVSVRRNSAVFKGSVLGFDSIVGENTVLENNTMLLNGTRISNINVADICCNAGQSSEGTVFYGYTPMKAALLGCCLGNVLGMPTIAVMSDGELNSTALKLSLLGGLVSVGAGCYDFGKGFLSSIFYNMNFCELQYGLFISGNSSGTVITFIDMKNKGLSHIYLNKLSKLLCSEQVKFSEAYQCKKVRVITSLGRLYISNLVNIVKYPLHFLPVIECENIGVRIVSNSALSKLKINSDGESVVFRINEKGTQLSAEYKQSQFNHETLKRIVSYYSFIGDTADSLSEWESMDAVIMCFKVINVLCEHGISLIEAQTKLPHVYVADGEVDFDEALSTLASHISEYADLSYKDDKLLIDDDGTQISISKMKNNNRLKITVKASSFDVAEELSGAFIDYIKRCNDNR